MKAVTFGIAALFLASAGLAAMPTASASSLWGVWVQRGGNIYPNVVLSLFIQTDGDPCCYTNFNWNTGDGAAGSLAWGTLFTGTADVGFLTDGRPFAWSVVSQGQGFTRIDITYSYLWMPPAVFMVTWSLCCDDWGFQFEGETAVWLDIVPWYSSPFPTPNPNVQQNPDGTCTVYDDSNFNGQFDEWETAYATVTCTVTPPDPKMSDNPDGSCTIYDDVDHDGVFDPAEEIWTFACPDPKTRSNPDGTTTVYDDKNDNNQLDAGEALATTPAADPEIRDNPDGTCTLYNDQDHDNIVDAGESIHTFACPDPRTRSNADGTITAYDDKNDNGTLDPGEGIATTPSLDPKVRDNPDGTCTLYNDANHNGAVDAGEALQAFACPDVKTQANGDGSFTVYDDKDDDGQADAGEPVLTVPSTNNVPFGVPPAGANQTVPGQSTPAVPSQPVNTPPVNSPPTCSLGPCNSPTTIPGQSLTIPGVPSQTLSTPPIPQQCVPIIICVGPIPSQTIASTPDVPPTPVGTDPQTVPAICTALGAICLPQTTFVPGQSQSTPAVDSIPLTPPISVSVSSTGLAGSLTPNLGETTPFGPINLQVGPVPVTLCPNTCPVPVAPEAHASSSVTVTIQIGAQSFSQTVPLDA